jgi:hypothetical protein
VQVEWGGFSDEPTMAIGARVVELPFIRRTREQVIG